MIAALLIFPCCAILWLYVCDWLGLVEDEPETMDDGEGGVVARPERFGDIE